jgi:hypothetical protein
MELSELLRQHGFIYPEITITRAQETELPLAAAMAMLQMETAGGTNEFGHDPGNPVQGGPVTASRYHEMRGYVAHGYPSQGVGPCQLTSTSLQDEADGLGGCWLVYHNMHVGFHFLKQLQTAYGVWGGFEHYNGSGPAAEAYAYRSVQLMNRYQALIDANK